MTPSITIRDVARRAGVSVATVSRVTSGNAKVSEDTLNRVNAALTSLGYEPSRLGQALALKRHNAFALVLPGLGGALFAGLLKGFEATLAGTGITFHVLVAQDPDRFQTQLKDLSTRVDGMCVFGSFAGDGIVSTIADRMPIVRVAGNPDAATHSVNVTNFEAARGLTRHLIGEHGLRDLLFLGEAAQSPDVQQRLRGFQDALAEAHVEVRRPAEPCSLTEAGGFKAMRAILDRGGRPEGLVCATDEIAIGALLACSAAGISVPGDLKMTGFDDIELASLITPSLTTARQPFHDIGARAAEILLERARPALQGTGMESMCLPTELIIRQSCGC